ncbi:MULTISPECIES: PRD domain-containing protein [unclassified Enterococcus]|uniref:BglG family transcription antiterminator n=1 Tax=unclassified Enterococcus TaxID=2608891 RepID=UPI0024730CDA|nr:MULTISPECIES: PRD domain-containing protein [unclassified Enterococcus]
MKEDTVSVEILQEKLKFSERKVRQLLRELRGYESRYAFQIETITKKGYVLHITDKARFCEFQDFLMNQKSGSKFSGKQERVILIVYLLLQNKNYVSLQQIADALDVSRSTILTDLGEVKNLLADYQIQLQSKPHYGMKLTGDEIHFRRLFSKIVSLGIDEQNESIGYFEHAEQLDFSNVTEQVKKVLLEQEIILSDNVWESILTHLKILVSRALNHNEVTELKVNKTLITPKFYQIAEKILAVLAENFEVQFAPQEVDLLASQLYGKATSESVPEQKKVEQTAMIVDALKKVDEEYYTSFSEDELLLEHLLFHIYPMILRISFGLELKNPVLPTISIRYANAFLVSLKFIELHSELSRHQLSRDEIGYLALHFAAHQERRNQQKLNDIKKIVLIEHLTRGQTLLLSSKIQAIFPAVSIQGIHNLESNDYAFQNVDLVLSTAPVTYDFGTVPYFMISDTLEDSEILSLKNNILYAVLQDEKRQPGLQPLFDEKLFFIENTEKDYLQILQKYSQKMVQLGYAATDFATIYDYGIAGPHSMKQNAIKNSIMVILLPEGINYENKSVKCIFLINIKKKQLFLHQEISEFLLKIMQQDSVERISQLVNFDEFKRYMKKYW